MNQLDDWTTNQELKNWIEQVAKLTTPNQIHLCTGSQNEANLLAQQMIQQGTFIGLKAREKCFLARSNPLDVARVEDCTFICSEKEEDAGPTNNWSDPAKMRERLTTLFTGCMKGRTLYVIPFSMGPVGSPLSEIGVEITDSPYVVYNMRLMTRMGTEVLDVLKNGPFVPCLHSVGAPLSGQDVPWPCNPENRLICHFPETREIWSFGSGYGGNALLGKKCLALRIASVMARDEGWLAEHMLILKLTNPENKSRYMAAAFPSSCGKTNLAMLTSTLPGWRVEIVGDDIAWMRVRDGKLFAINPEYGFFGVAPGTSYKSNPNAMESIKKNTVFTNVALTPEGDVWWEGMTDEAPPRLIDWQGRTWNRGSSEKAAHPNARFTAPIRQCPVIDPAYDSPEGVPISAILFGGRRASLWPVVTESFDWTHGVFFGASVSSEMTAAAEGSLGVLRHDPFAMLPFCGYNMGDYFAHWLKMGSEHFPKIFFVNWFLKGADGRFLWPGFGENVRALKWIFERCDGKDVGEASPIGILPKKGSFDLSGLNGVDFASLFNVDKGLWLTEVENLSRYFTLFGERFPPPLREELLRLRDKLL